MTRARKPSQRKRESKLESSALDMVLNRASKTEPDNSSFVTFLLLVLWWVLFCFVFGLVCFFAFPSYIPGVHHFWVRFLRMWPFFNPAIKVVTFRLRGWCVLGVFLLPAFTRLGHEHQDLLSPWRWNRWNACVHRLDLGLYSHPKEFWGEWSLNPC